MLPFGNPIRSVLPYFKRETFLDSLIPELSNYPYPDNNSQEVIDEVNKLIQFTNATSENKEAQSRFEIYDENFEEYIIDVLVYKGIADRKEVEGLIRDLHEDILPLLVKIKYNYQRIRPIQLSYLLEMKLYPFASKSNDTPSYPSGHTYQSKIYCEVLGNKYPKYYKQLQELAQDITVSRLYIWEFIFLPIVNSQNIVLI